MKKNLSRLCALACLLPCLSTVAYHVTIPLSDRNQSTLQHGFTAGAKKLILSLTANQKAPDSLGSDIAHARNWVDQYSLSKNPGDTDHPWLLQATYSDRSIQKLLQQHELPYWKRTPAPVDIVLKTNHDESLQDNDPRWEMLAQAAENYGYSFKLLKQAPNTRPDNLLVGVLADDNSSPTHWSWYHDGQWCQWEQPLDEQWANQIASSIGQELVQSQPTQVDDDLTPIHLRITGLQSFSDYTQATQALKKLHGVRDLSDDGIQGDQLAITLITDRPLPTIKRGLDRIKQLVQSSIPPANLTDTDFNYRWQNHPSKPTGGLHYRHQGVDEESYAYDNS